MTKSIEFNDPVGLTHEPTNYDISDLLQQQLSEAFLKRPHSLLNRRGRAISADFLDDLEFAGDRATSSLLVVSESGRDLTNLFAAIDGLDASERPPSQKLMLLKLVSSMTDHKTALNFEPAISVSPRHGQEGFVNLEPECVCVINSALTTSYFSSDLGFRDLCHVSQSAVIFGLLLRARALGIEIDPSSAIRLLGETFGTKLTMPNNDTSIQETSITTPKRRESAYLVALQSDN